MNPILTIAIPTYNRARFLSKTLDSIISEYCEGVEILISDNGSVDETLQIVNKYKQKFSYIRSCGFEENKGIDKNILNAILNSKGEYVHLCSDDDLFTKGLLEEVLAEIQRTRPSVISLNHFSFKQSGEVLPPYLPCKRALFTNGRKFFKHSGLGFLSSLIFKREKSLCFFHKVRSQKECAHLDIVSRIALSDKGPFICLGKTMIAGRSLDTPRYNMMKSCVINQKELHDELLTEGLLDKKSHLFFTKRLLRDTLRIVYKMLLKSDDVKSCKNALKNSFGEFPMLSLTAYVFLSINRKVILSILLPVSKIYSFQRACKRILHERTNEKTSF